MTIHSSHPFADDSRDVFRQLRARLGGRVTLWAAGIGAERAGLTVSSLVLVGGDPPYVVGFLDPDSDLAERLAVGSRFVVSFLEWAHRDIAEQFAGLMPAPGGAFSMSEWEDLAAGPRLASVSTWAACTVTDLRELGWSLQVTGTLDEGRAGADAEPLLHRRGRYVRLGSGE